MVARAVGGRITPGSGNKNVKGDVRLDKEGWMFEVKQTSKPRMSVQAIWLRKLEIHQSTCDLCLVIFFGLRGYPYYYKPDPIDLRCVLSGSVTVSEDALPCRIRLTHNGVWELDDWNSLYDLKG